MDKSSILKKRFEECNISEIEIFNYISQKNLGEFSILVYISQFEGLGNKDSDFDIYVLTEKKIGLPTEMLKIKNACCDIEYWSEEDIDVLTESIDYFNYKQLKIIKKMSLAYLISGNDSALIEKIRNIKIDDYIYSYFKSFANAEYDDAVKMFKNHEYIACLSCCQRTVDYWIASVNAKMGRANLNLKWANKIFVDNNGYDKQILDNYLNIFVYRKIDKKNIEKAVSDMLDFLTDNNNAFMFFS
ncbi:hypothetical protein SAMN04487831_11640 [Pseudobutyrivibrio sp. UC1225]|uniref:hypothetical protein n=1 Tax=Pseudobutyrivibrio sp. UC1225 TaxID=1798185 RepID=UPI0008E052E5|nr:hypothetical protein [Pseudobutyrivibrio sp. UC1225]SFO28772.1 hypothetical protein SAMN04487831_11640 [Pseudobutyrivibrio sp. UC1225]